MHLDLSVVSVYKHQSSIHLTQYHCYINSLNNRHDFPKPDTNVTWCHLIDINGVTLQPSWAMTSMHFLYWSQKIPAYESTEKCKIKINSIFLLYWGTYCKTITLPLSESNCSELSLSTYN